MPQYIFPCEHCDHSFELVLRQAGQQLTCPLCQNATEAPMLGSMKQLEMVSGTEVTAKQPSGAQGWKNILFGAGLVLALFAGGGGAWLFRFTGQMKTEFNIDTEMAQFSDDIDALSSSQVMELYARMKIEDGLGDWYEPRYIRYNKQSEILRPLAFGLLGLGGLGLLTMVGAATIKN
jgi:hypothetical protein